MRIVLIGFMGAGKSTVGIQLSKKFELTHIDTDTEILKYSNRGSITDIFKVDGETVFRELEHRVIVENSSKTNIVISTGGGLPLQKSARLLLKQHSPLDRVVYLYAKLDVLLKRLGSFSRPLYTSNKKLYSLYGEREPYYKKWATEIIDSSNLSIDETIDILMRNSLNTLYKILL